MKIHFQTQSSLFKPNSRLKLTTFSQSTNISFAVNATTSPVNRHKRQFVAGQRLKMRRVWWWARRYYGGDAGPVRYVGTRC